VWGYWGGGEKKFTTRNGVRGRKKEKGKKKGQASAVKKGREKGTDEAESDEKTTSGRGNKRGEKEEKGGFPLGGTENQTVYEKEASGRRRVANKTGTPGHGTKGGVTYPEKRKRSLKPVVFGRSFKKEAPPRPFFQIFQGFPAGGGGKPAAPPPPKNEKGPKCVGKGDPFGCARPRETGSPGRKKKKREKERREKKVPDFPAMDTVGDTRARKEKGKVFKWGAPKGGKKRQGSFSPDEKKKSVRRFPVLSWESPGPREGKKKREPK